MAETRRIGIIGKGNVGTALEDGWSQAGYDVRSVGRDPDRVQRVADWAQVVVLAVPYPERQNAFRDMGNTVQGKVLVDVTNAVTSDGFAGSIQKSGAEELQAEHANVRVVKAFNTVFAQNMPTGTAGGETLTLFAAGDDEAARRTVLELGQDLGFDAVDAGPLQNARWLEVLGYFNITMGYQLGQGTDTGFRYVHPRKTVQEQQVAQQQT